MTPAPTTGAPTPDEIRRICQIRDPLVRNLEITHAYFLLSRAMTIRTGDCANWCTFAVWASRQAGSTIRAEDLLAGLRRRLSVPARWAEPIRSLWRSILRRGVLNPESWVGRVVRAIHSPFDVFERASAAVARGNLRVFEEIGLHFARYLHVADFDEFAAALDENQSLLRNAFGRYEQQRSCGDPCERAQLLLLANLEIGLHEQTRLQPEIREVLDSPAVTAEDLGRRVLRASGYLTPYRWAALAAGAALMPLSRFARAITRAVVTDRLMTLDAAGTLLRLGDHLEAVVPEHFQTLLLDDLRALAARFEPNACIDCGARDWADLTQRMHYILHLFRGFHYRPQLLQPPFTERQVTDIRSGRLPDGAL